MNSIDTELISNFNSEQHRLVVNILFTYKWLSVKIDKVLKERGITQVQYNVLRILLGSYPNTLAVGDLKRRMINKKTDVTRILDRLSSKELISRGVCKDNRRQVNVSINKLGINLMEELSPLIKVEFSNYYSQAISDKDARIANEALDSIRNWEQ